MKNLRYLRESCGLSQQKLADMLGTTTQQNIQKYETGASQPDFQMLRQLADFFDTSVDYLMGYTDIKTKIEKIEKYALTVEEEQFIDGLRELAPEYKVAVKKMITAFQTEPE